jgi:hypothetical protein
MVESPKCPVAGTASPRSLIPKYSADRTLAATHDLETALGTFSFDEHRDGHHSAVMQIVEDSAFVVFR